VVTISETLNRAITGVLFDHVSGANGGTLIAKVPSRLAKNFFERVRNGGSTMKAQFNSPVSRFTIGLLVLVALIATTVSPALGQSKRRPRPRRTTTRIVVKKPLPVAYYTLKSGQVIRVRMNQSITSETARVGDQFTTTVVDPVYANSLEVIPAGSSIVGEVRNVKRASRQSKAGTIEVHFVSLRLPTGITRAINADLSEVTTENVNADNEGEVSGKSATKRNVVFIGGGAATGALIGAIAGGGKGAGIGAGVGAGLGVVGAMFSKGHEAVVESGSEFGVVLNQSLSLPSANVR
jgi:hypothetical protein